MAVEVSTVVVKPDPTQIKAFNDLTAASKAQTKSATQLAGATGSLNATLKSVNVVGPSAAQTAAIYKAVATQVATDLAGVGSPSAPALQALDAFPDPGVLYAAALAKLAQSTPAVTAVGGSSADATKAAASPAPKAPAATAAQPAYSLETQLKSATTAVQGFATALGKHDWATAATSLESAFKAIQGAFEKGGLTDGLLTTASTVGSLIGGKTGKAVGTLIGLGTAGYSLGGIAASLGKTIGAFANSGAAVAQTFGSLTSVIPGIGDALGSIGGALGAIAPALGPIGVIAGVGLALGSLLKGKPTNAGAGIALTPDAVGALSGDKRTADTEKAATTAADAILQGEGLLRQAGATLGTTVSGLVIGTRDLSQIYLTNGQTLKTAVGDASAATEAALDGVLSGATFANQAEQSLVDSMLAAGKGFDDVTAALQNFANAQAISGGLADQIEQLSDPQTYATDQVKKDIQTQRDAAQTAADAGYLTADQLNTINGQLSTLEGLKLDQVAKQYGVDLAAAAKAASDTRIQDAETAEATARTNLTNIYNAQASALQNSIQAAQQYADSLTDFSQSLTSGADAMLDPIQQYATTKAQFDALSALPAGDATRLAGLQDAGEAFLAASKAAAPTQAAYNQDLAAVRQATDASAKAASDQVDTAQQQLDALNASVSGLLDLNTTVATGSQDITAAIAALASAMTVTEAAREQAPGASTPANDNVDIAKYLADNPDIAAEYSKYAAGTSAYQGFFAAGLTEDQFALAHYQQTGQYEIARGLRHFATGGAFNVGGYGGTDSQLVQFMASPDERVSVQTPGQQSSGGDDGSAASEVRMLRAELAAALATIAQNTGKAADQALKVSQTGMPVRGLNGPTDSILTKAA